MIWVLLGILLFGTGGSESILSSIDEVQARVSEVVEDDERRTWIETALEQFKADFGRARTVERW